MTTSSSNLSIAIRICQLTIRMANRICQLAICMTQRLSIVRELQKQDSITLQHPEQHINTALNLQTLLFIIMLQIQYNYAAKILTCILPKTVLA